MIPKISQITVLNDYILKVTFDDNKTVIYDVKEDFDSIPAYNDMLFDKKLFRQFVLDSSRTIIVWNDIFDLPSDIIYEYGKIA